MAADTTEARKRENEQRPTLAARIERISLPVAIASVVLGVLVLAAALAADFLDFYPSYVQQVLLGVAELVGSLLGAMGIGTTAFRWWRIAVNKEGFSLKKELEDRLMDLPDYAQQVEKPISEGIKTGARFVTDRMSAVAVPAALLVVTTSTVLATGVVVAQQSNAVTSPPVHSARSLSLPTPTLVPTLGPAPTAAPGIPVFYAELAQQDRASCNGPNHMILTNTGHTKTGQPTTETIRWSMTVSDSRFKLTPARGTLPPSKSVTVLMTGPYPLALGQAVSFTYQIDGDFSDDTWGGVTCSQTP